jgi:hypothetical protein
VRRRIRNKLIATAVALAIAAGLLLLLGLTGLDDGAKTGLGLVIGMTWGVVMSGLWLDELLDWCERTFG